MKRMSKQVTDGVARQYPRKHLHPECAAGGGTAPSSAQLKRGHSGKREVARRVSDRKKRSTTITAVCSTGISVSVSVSVCCF